MKGDATNRSRIVWIFLRPAPLSPLTPALSPLRGEGERSAALVRFCHQLSSHPLRLRTRLPPQTEYVFTMKTLAEIKRAAERLTGTEKTELLYFLAQRLGDTTLPLPEPREFSAEQLAKWMDEDEADMRRFQTGA